MDSTVHHDGHVGAKRLLNMSETVKAFTSPAYRIPVGGTHTKFGSSAPVKLHRVCVTPGKAVENFRHLPLLHCAPIIPPMKRGQKHHGESPETLPWTAPTRELVRP